ncbi:MAG: hypothetical protein EPN91_04650 [Salinibacterium sp.]|nr:MAG: hypothetical protein EPN91_04650 [Salinibacterium sp.]
MVENTLAPRHNGTHFGKRRQRPGSKATKRACPLSEEKRLGAIKRLQCAPVAARGLRCNELARQPGAQDSLLATQGHGHWNRRSGSGGLDSELGVDEPSQPPPEREELAPELKELPPIMALLRGLVPKRAPQQELLLDPLPHTSIIA